MPAAPTFPTIGARERTIAAGVRAKISSSKPYLAFLAICVLLTVALVTQRNGLPHGIGWIAFALAGGVVLWIFGDR
jgi:hypothetical protein